MRDDGSLMASENAQAEIARGLAAAIEAAAEALADLGLSSNEAGEFITDAFVGCDWSDYFEEDKCSAS